MRSALDAQACYLPAVVVYDLLRRATSSERPVVEGLAIACGILWRCRCGETTAVVAPPEVCHACRRAR